MILEEIDYLWWLPGLSQSPTLGGFPFTRKGTVVSVNIILEAYGDCYTVSQKVLFPWLRNLTSSTRVNRTVVAHLRP